MIRSRTRLRWTQGLVFAGLALGLILLASHVHRNLIEAELALSTLLLLTVLGSIEAVERDAVLMRGTLAPLIAIVGTDGSGKSTLSADMCRSFVRKRPTALAYLGLGTGDLGNRIKQWPIIGARIERKLARKASQTRDVREKIPGLPTALVVYGLSLLRVHRFRRVLALRSRGIAVITDRYPQEEIPGFYDGPGLAAARPGSRIVARLAARELRLYQWMASFTPDLVLRLNVDAATALARKPDHKAHLVAAKVAVTPLLRFHDAPIVDIDATASYDQVRRQAFASVEGILGRQPQSAERQPRSDSGTFAVQA
ncbi:nucleoside triphosphate hydrolase [Sphingomonas sp. BIUV-7]|uniref:Nucleoside triphosphate hydrolase n=1 Tax=Sphingomonas natans TaxID=3063330 RepID=A0ABT8YC00_9SPHN|nr:nucleoside triphosphate hydrolase [Sphingomonas sp. BIUV-7]MDO6415861.1 nucleoside triphosphate hydrolase [Sphingomonas sp. BIUV-7]